MSERWLPVPGWEGLYSVSSAGRVRREAREVRGTHKTRWGSLAPFVKQLQQKVLKPNMDTGGYLQVVLQEFSSGRRKTCTVHRLVLSAFVRPPAEVCHAMHKNDIRSDNRLSNLRWGTRQENIEDMRKKGRLRGGGTGRYLSEQTYRAIQSRPNDRLADLAAEFGTSKSNVSKIRAKGKL